MNALSPRTRLGLDILGVAALAGLAGDTLLRAIGAQIRIRHDVLRVVVITQQPVGEVVGGVHMHQQQPLKILKSLHPLRIGELFVT